MSVLSRTLTLLAALPIAMGLSATAGHAAPVTSSVSASATSSGEWGGYENGMIPESALCAISWQPVDHLRCDAAGQLAALNTVYKARWGSDICVNDAYRSYEKQVALYKELGPGVAAVPGTSTTGGGWPSTSAAVWASSATRGTCGSPRTHPGTGSRSPSGH